MNETRNDMLQAAMNSVNGNDAVSRDGRLSEAVVSASLMRDWPAGLEQARAELGRLVAASRSVLTAQMNVSRAEAVAADYLHDTDVRFSLLRLKEIAGCSVDMLKQWSDLLLACPGDMRVVRCYAARLVKERNMDGALALVDRYLPEALDADPDVGFARAEFLADIRAYEASDALYRRLIERHDHRNLRVAFAKRLYKRGQLIEAVEVMKPVSSTLAVGSKARRLAAALTDDYAFFCRFETAAGLSGQDLKIIAMKRAILQFRNRVLPARPVDKPVNIALVTGSLGPGGAERQLTRLAVQLQRHDNVHGSNDGAVRMRRGAVEVLVKRHSAPTGFGNGQRLDFYLGTLREARIPVTEINGLPVVPAARQGIGDPDLLRFLERLPSQVHYGVTRLAPHLRERKFDVVSLWQDGTCLIGALAALLAGVRVIHLVFRGLPPNIRRERDRPEYAVLYRALAEVPGVQFVSNSRTVACEYAEWLGLPPERFHILYNGVPELDTTPSTEDEGKWLEFAARTQDATETIGGVFRFEPDKRPLLWIKMAARYMKLRPRARFVIVGDGRLLDSAAALASELGVAERLLFVGLSSRVGFWYSKLDVKVLLSRYEGLPNVLIEAQLLGVAAVSTPAGGAGECFIPGVTGHLLASVEHPDLNEACEQIAALVDSARMNETISEHCRSRARMLFSVNAMTRRFSELCRGDEHENGRSAPVENPLAA